MTSVMPSVDAGAERVYLHPGQLFVTGDAAIVTTILGSCVSVCLWDEQALVAGINHFLLPVNPARTPADPRYGNTAMTRLVAALIERGAAVPNLVAKVFGGASVIPSFSGARKAIGDQNVIAAHEALEKAGIRIAGEQTGGQRGRKLVFFTANGSAFVKEI